MRNYRKSVGIIGFFSMLIFFGSAIAVFAKEPQFMVSWKPMVYAPVWYEGKLLPVVDGSVQVSFEALEQNGNNVGKIIDLSNREVRWYVGGELVRRGLGLQTLIVRNKDYSGSPIEIKIAIDFSDSETDERYFAQYFVSIPVGERTLSLVRRSMNQTIAPGEQTTWYLIPLFFSQEITGSRVEWFINGSQVINDKTNPFSFTVQAGDADQYIDIKASFSDPNSIWENASAFDRVFVR